MEWTVLIALFFGGLLAGGELVVRFGVRGPLARLDPHSHIEMRQGLIRTLRVLVPILFALALLSNIAAAVAAATPLRIGVVVLLLGFISVTLAGTVPINQAVSSWNPAAPPSGWKNTIRRWERLDDWRTLLATSAFALALSGAAVIR
ncbi:MAG TPA: DUF1772 domain-containing protein [Sphingomonas sp.]|nr:DUF1772 domain-containing protein [Sphingomonas sp.]